MSTPAGSPPSGGFIRALTAPLQQIVRAIGRIPANARAGILTATLLVIVALGGLAFLDDINTLHISFFVVICAAILLATLKKDALLSVALLLVFAILTSAMSQLRPGVPEVTPVPQDSADQALRPITGRVVDGATRQGVEGVRLRAVNTEVAATTDPYGDFDLAVPRLRAAGDSILLEVRHQALDTMVWAPLEGSRVRLFMNGGAVAARAAAGNAAARPGPVPAAPLMSAARLAPRTPRVPLTVILDSIVTVRDGSRGPSQWSFDVEVNGRDVLALRRRPYRDDAEDARRLFVGAEAVADVFADRPVRLGVQGNRANLLFFRFHKVDGMERIDLDRLPPDTPVPVRVTAVDAAGRGQEGEFRFFFTLLLQSPAAAD
jgi:hypothetical protein